MVLSDDHRMSRVGQSVVIRGEVTSEEDLTIEGRVHGSVLVRNGTVFVGSTARVDADIRGARVQISGEVRGGVSAAERIELAPSATVTGTLSADHVVIADGATFNGSIDMGRRTLAARIAQYRSAAT